jgi:murein DD-endopeptidase MepM/ murein hydrolase activator NlpD
VTNPVPGVPVSTPFGVRGTHWGCRRDGSGRGIHTGADFAAPTGRTVVAARPGVVRHVSYGPAFGTQQVAVEVAAAAGGGADFYAHMASRVPNGTRVAAGARVGTVGASGNVTGPHLHFERHVRFGVGWSCDVVTDPAPSIRWEEPPMSLSNNDVERIARAVWEHRIGDPAQPARWWVVQTQRIARRFLGPTGETPDRTLLQRVWDAVR